MDVPQDEVTNKIVPSICLLIEDGISYATWKYFSKQWIPIIDKWEIYNKGSNLKNIMNHTHNGVELYNIGQWPLPQKKFVKDGEAEPTYQKVAALNIPD
eukprot:221609-Ditylum_brightwellii.AAC.1